MDIHAIFDENYSGPLVEAAWIVESAANREWFAAAKGRIGPNSAIFSLDRYRSVESALCHVVWGIEGAFPTVAEDNRSRSGVHHFGARGTRAGRALGEADGRVRSVSNLSFG